MSEQKDRSDQYIATARWLTLLATVGAFIVIWAADPQRLDGDADGARWLLFAALVLVYYATVTLFAKSGWLPAALPAATVAGDVAVVLVAYLIFGPATENTWMLTDPLIFLALLPVIVSAVRFHWTTGAAVGVLIAVVRALLLLRGVEEVWSAEGLLPALYGLFLLVGSAFLSGYLSDRVVRRAGHHGVLGAQAELENLRPELERAQALEEMTAELSATLSFERVLQLALDIAERALEEWGGRGQLVGLVFLFEEGRRMRLADSRDVPRHERQQRIAGRSGIVARCLDSAEPVVTPEPGQDPELAGFTRLSECSVAVAVPMRAGLENYGAMVFAARSYSSYTPDQIGFFSAIASRASIALHNALLYQNLRAERDRIIAVEEEARRKLARDLHDGPTQSVSAVAMRLNFARKRMGDNPPLMLAELERVEEMARQSVKEIRQLLFTLRPLVLETQGLVAALHSLADKIHEMSGLNIQIRDPKNVADRLTTHQAGILFYIIEEALGNARKHSEASLVVVQLAMQDSLLVVQVADNGVGFDARDVFGGYETRGSLGMINMRERAALIDGSLDVKSTLGEGTIITIVVPLEEGP